MANYIRRELGAGQVKLSVITPGGTLVVPAGAALLLVFVTSRLLSWMPAVVVVALPPAFSVNGFIRQALIADTQPQGVVMSKLKYVIIATLLAIPMGWALRAQTSKPATLTATDYLELQQLVARYSYALDMHGGDGSAFAALFAPDGSLGTQAKGTAQLAAFAAQTNTDRSGPAFARHFVTNVVIKPAPEGATGRSYLVTLDISEEGKPASMLSGGHYDDVYVKTPQGWRIKSRNYVQSEIGPQQ